MYLNNLSRLQVTSRHTTNAKLAIQGHRSAVELFGIESLEIALCLLEIGIDCAEMTNHTGDAMESKEYKKFKQALDFTLFAISYANCCRLPRIDKSDLELEIERLGQSDYRLNEFHRRFDQFLSADFLYCFEREILSTLSEYSQCILMAIACVVVDAIGKDFGHRLVINDGDIDFANSNDDCDFVDAIEVLNRNSREFADWVDNSMEDCVHAFRNIPNGNPRDEGVMYLGILNYFLKVIWSAYESRLPRLKANPEPYLRNMGEEDILWKRLGSYFDPLTSDDFLKLLYVKTRRLGVFTRCHFLNVASMIMEAWHKEVSCP